MAIYDTKHKFGGISYFVRAETSKNCKELTPLYAYPAIKSILQLFSKRGSNYKNLEASIVGGSENKSHKLHQEEIHIKNFQTALKILKENKIKIINTDTGGYRGRKVIFNSKTGEMIVAKVNTIRETDWYPKVI